MESKEFDIRITRGSGPGGQHKNKVETCVIITHIPTGLQEKCQDTRSKIKNIEIAKERIIAKIERDKNKKVNEEKNKRRIELIQTQKVVRTYNFVRNEVYDHRTKTRHDLRKFMKGEIEL
jgi:peptide chain release factor 1